MSREAAMRQKKRGTTVDPYVLTVQGRALLSDGVIVEGLIVWDGRKQGAFVIPSERPNVTEFYPAGSILRVDWRREPSPELSA